MFKENLKKADIKILNNWSLYNLLSGKKNVFIAVFSIII